MTYVRKGGLVYLIQDRLVPKYTSDGFKVLKLEAEKSKEETQVEEEIQVEEETLAEFLDISDGKDEAALEPIIEEKPKKDGGKNVKES